MSCRAFSERAALPRQCRIDARPALGALSVKTRDGGIDLAARGLNHAAEFLRRHDDGDTAATARDANGLGLSHLDEVAEAVAGGGDGEGVHR